MKNYNIEKNIYSKDGRLLLAAGQEITESTLHRLKSIDYSKASKIILSNEKRLYENDVLVSSKIIKLNLKSSSLEYYNRASDRVAKILFDSKNQPWWIYINTLSNYVDWLYTHALNVSLMSIMIADAFNLEMLDEIALGAFLHDIGKLMIPKSIIQKPAKLSDEEMVFVKQHCDLGVSMVSEYKLSKISLDIIGQHHEKLDGSGYPQGLQDTEIPVPSRIVMVADVVDAITSYRPYKSNKSMKTAINELNRNPDKYPRDVIDIISTLLL